MTLMDTPYNLTQLQESTRVVDLITFSNSATNNIFSVFMILSVFFVMLLLMKNRPFKESFTVTGFICFTLSLLLVFAGMLDFIYVIIFAIIMAAGAFLMYVSD